MTIRRKIQLGVVVILLMFAGLSGFAINQMTVMSRHFSGLTEKVIPTLGLSAQISLVLDKLRVTQAYQVLEQNSQQANVLQMDVGKLQARMYKLIQQYRQVVTDPAQQSALDFLENDFNAYMESWDSLRAGADSNLAGRALEVLRSSAPIHARLRSRVADLDDLTRDLADKAGAASEAAADAARTGAIVAVVVLTIMLGGLIVLSNRDILMPMRRLIATIDRLADGDLASDIPLVTRRDENQANRMPDTRAAAPQPPTRRSAGTSSSRSSTGDTRM